MREAATQMERPGVILDVSEDRFDNGHPSCATHKSMSTISAWLMMTMSATKCISARVSDILL